MGTDRDARKRKLPATIRTLFVLLVGACIAEAFFFAAAGRANIDEGMFLEAGRLVFEGQLPYRDFPLSQGPLIAYVYGLALELFGGSLWVGRLLSWALGVGGFAAALVIAWRFGGRIGGAVLVVLWMMNLPLLWVLGTVRTQSLSTPLTLLGTLALVLPRVGVFSWALSPSLFLWSTSARLTNGLAFAAVAIWTAYALRRQPRRLAGVAGIVGLQGLLVFAPVLLAPREALFHILTAQLGRGERAGPRSVSLAEELLAKFEIFLEPATSFFAVLGLSGVVVLCLAARWRQGWRPDFGLPLEERASAQLGLLVLAMLVFVPHLLLDRGYLTYFVTSSALLAPAIAIAVAEMVRSRTRFRSFGLAAAAALVIAGLLAATMQLTAWVGSGDASFSHFRDVARSVRAHAGQQCTMVTMETALAVEAGCRVLPGLEYSLFSYFPRLSDEQARRRGVVNRNLLVQRVREHRPELIVLGPRGRSSLRLPRTPGSEPSPGFLAPRGYRHVDRQRISSGAFVRSGPDTVEVDVFVREAS